MKKRNITENVDLNLIKILIPLLWSDPYDLRNQIVSVGPNSDMGRRVETVNGRLEVDDEEKERMPRVWSSLGLSSHLFIAIYLFSNYLYRV